ncbi:Similar to Glycogenin-2; acc. no. O15488 [Pyronema omphalodes CBS 100304]|uniref:glycogenin glucosyltransferase n=1 Tax=Pyronema omphalodes (strain CBS 100304) TaxID=1076935 RepID=U4LD65_PYROM|nr:Similar to Glycogenin-2; acc. no. O15488 [Pyronema omphalodes CBS 100304]
MSSSTEDVYCTLLLNDGYLPGAQVLAHSLRDGLTTRKLAVMVTLGGVNKETIVELKKLYDYVIPVEPLHSNMPSNLDLMGRPDLNAALTKIHLWKQTQFRKVIYIDADMVALRAPDELFDLTADFSASPDIGWPDCFNSGFMVMHPNLKTHGELTQLASEGKTFDGADQGLLNQYFTNWNRIPFTYNCTVGINMAYQYAPAFNHYEKDVTMVHFIGASKPWDRGYVPGLPPSNTPYDKLSGHWWNVWNKHKNASAYSTPQQLQNAGGEQKSLSGSQYTGAVGGSATEQEMHQPFPAEILGSSSPTGRPAGATQQQQSQQNPPQHQQYQQVQSQEFRRGSVGIIQSTTMVSELESNTPTSTPNNNQPKFVPIRSIDQPSRYHENFAAAEQQRIAAQQQQQEEDQEPAPPTYYEAQKQTHYEQYRQGHVPEHVLTKEGLIAQDQYFQTGRGSYYVERNPSRIAHPKTPSPQPTVPRRAVFSAPTNNWDPTKSAPPQHGQPEAAKLHVQLYENAWDKPLPLRSSAEPMMAQNFAPLRYSIFGMISSSGGGETFCKCYLPLGK